MFWIPIFMGMTEKGEGMTEKGEGMTEKGEGMTEGIL